MPDRQGMAQLLDQCLSLLFPGAFGNQSVEEKSLTHFLQTHLEWLRKSLVTYTLMAFNFQIYQLDKGKTSAEQEKPLSVKRRAEEAVEAILNQFPAIRKILSEDLHAAFEGDPAAGSVAEVLLSYPFIQAIAAHRIAHGLYGLKVPYLPRMLNEVAHSRTGIDIHPGANIGPAFFIDHGTGVVIGETAVIGRNVKLYQGVTLGALSFPKDKDGNPVKGIKRHPNIEDGVTIYAGATVLGGKTTIGRNSIIGGNCWITASVPPDTMVLSEKARQKHK